MNGSGGSSFNATTPTPNFDNLLVQSLMSRLQLRPPSHHAPPQLSAAKSLEELLFSDMLLNLPESGSDSENDDSSSSSKTQLTKEESRLEKEIVRTILTGEIEKLKPNSGQAIAIGEHHICVGFQEETGSGYRVWEWHGHIMLFDDENGYTPEYIYGNYFEKLDAANRKMKKTAKTRSDDDDDDDDDKKEREEEEEKLGNLGLKELIDNADSSSVRVLHRNLNANSGPPRF